MPLSWNEIKTRAAAFVLEWKDKAPSAREEADAQTFEAGFLNIFGDEGRKKAVFEYKVALGETKMTLFGEETSGDQRGYIDLLWKGKILIEMKSPGKEGTQERVLSKAYEQAKTYADALPSKEFPKGILICDFINFHYYDFTKDLQIVPDKYRFTLSELADYVTLFGHLAGYSSVEYKQLDPVNIQAAETMARLHDRLKEIGYQGHRLELYLCRLVFCLFADDTGIFEPANLFHQYINERTSKDGSDLAPHLEKIFETLNEPRKERLKTIDEQLNLFPYVNGGLFEEHLKTADFDRKMRDALLECCALDWSKISPAIFGSMFQSVMNDEERHDLGAHYTSEQNILKVIHPLFLDDLWDEFNKIKIQNPGTKKHNLALFHAKLCRLKFLDPACGCGNFLVISYRELRLLEIEIIKEILKGEQVIDIEIMIRVNVDQFYGIEIEEFPVRIAQTALWLMDHLMNNQASAAFGKYIVRIPLRASATIVNANSLTTDWESIVPKNGLSYILGNPPFLGARIMSKEQKMEVNQIFEGMKDNSNLDYVTCWYKKAAHYIKGTNIEVAFVSTNSICQGEQVPILWPELINKHGIRINFAHQTFKWSNEARGKAAVYCVIIGFSLNDRKEKRLYHYASVTDDPTETTVSRINAYLINAPVIYIQKATKPICKVSEMVFGNMPNDGGNFLLTEEEKNQLLEKEPDIKELIRPFLGADEFINSIPKYCIWLNGISPAKYQKSKEIQRRISEVRNLRTNSAREATRKLADLPMLFGEIRQPDTDYLLIPRVSSEKRRYIPIGFFTADIIAGDTTLVIPNATLYEFGVITSTMHMAWTRYVCGRLKSDYRYSASIVYNNFPWPNPTDNQKSAIETSAQSVLDVRKKYPELSLAMLYDSNTMAPELVKAHQKLDKAVENAYGRKFDDDSRRVAYLFELYQKLTGDLFKDEKKRGKGRKK
ncbi:MAG: N-6 DNA methylase [Treponema sp.]|jgi:type I restriction-modification system DNA methylase subunit|nr:N-6 DNA methylase [Treponema sp.]